MKIIIMSDYDEMSVKSAKITANYINRNPNKLICFAAGNTPLGTFYELIAMQGRGEVDLSSVFYAQLDEWVGLGPDDTGSCLKMLTDSFFKPAGISRDRLHVFDGLADDLDSQCRLMEEWINKRGDIGFALLGIGMNGHIGVNEPNAPDVEGCFTINLDDVTKTVSSKYFGKSLPVETGITIGWKTLMQASEILLQASGKEKAQIVKEAFQGEITMDLPASLLQNHQNSTVMLDKDSAFMLNYR